MADEGICTSAGSREQRLIWRIGFFVSSTRGGCCSSAANGCNELASRAAASNERLFAGQQLISKVRGSRCRYIEPLQMFGGLVIGLVLALLWPSFAQALQPIGTAFIEAIKMIIIPLIVASVSLGTYKMGTNLGQLGRVAGISFAWFYFATFCAILIALGLDGLFHPGLGVGLVPTGKVPPNLAVSIDWVKFFLNLIPSNIVAVMASGKLLPTLVFSVLFGVALAGIGEQAQPIVGLLEAIMAAMFRLTRWIIALSPLAILAIMAYLFATQGLAPVLGLAKLIGLMYVGLVIEIGIFCVILAAMGKRPLHVFRRMLWPAESSRQRPPRRTAPRTIIPLPLAIRGSPYDLSNQIVSNLTPSYTPKYLAGLWPLT
jgi:hypothetical protein